MLELQGKVPNGIVGTITMVDTLGEGDEREFSSAVASAYEVRNEQVVDYWLWQDDGMEPPLTEAPTLNYPFWARDRRCCEIVRTAGGRVLLTGQGSDQYLYGMPFFLADWLVEGRWPDAWRGVAEWAVLTRGSFWRVAHENAVVPLLPAWLRRKVRPRYQRMPPWLRREFAKSFAVEDRHAWHRVHSAPRGQKYAGAIACETSNFGRFGNRTLFSETFELRHPFLYRPLVELSLRLPPELRTRPTAQKWILREAMRGTLPEVVRTRVGKGGIDARVAWSLEHEGGRVAELLRDPLLADLGCIEPARIREALEEVRGGRTRHVAFLMISLSIETWLRARSGRWTVRESAPARALQLA
jgi:asparagine synthase (glutamine-hydrolysing)